MTDTLQIPSSLSQGISPHSLKTGWPWPYFSQAEMACRHCGESYAWPEFMSRLQTARERSGQAFHVLSAHRCALHNARVGGAPLSQHLRLAADIALSGHDPSQLYTVCREAGFTGFGFYSTFLHIDLGPSRRWFGNERAKILWQAYLD
ncbi:MAG: YcbK family protein [Alphaproteobacteria bacterium]